MTLETGALELPARVLARFLASVARATSTFGPAVTAALSLAVGSAVWTTTPTTMVAVVAVAVVVAVMQLNCGCLNDWQKQQRRRSQQKR